jgi:hypothetical protein
LLFFFPARSFTGSGLGPVSYLDGLLLGDEKVLADRCLCRVDDVFLIDVGRVGAHTAVYSILLTVGSEDRVIARAAEQIVHTEPAVYAVVAGSAKYLVETTAAVAVVVACQTKERICGAEPVEIRSS